MDMSEHSVTESASISAGRSTVALGGEALLRVLRVCAGAATMGLDGLISTLMKLMGDQKPY